MQDLYVMEVKRILGVVIPYSEFSRFLFFILHGIFRNPHSLFSFAPLAIQNVYGLILFFKTLLPLATMYVVT